MLVEYSIMAWRLYDEFGDQSHIGLFPETHIDIDERAHQREIRQRDTFYGYL